MGMRILAIVAAALAAGIASSDDCACAQAGIDAVFKK